MWTYEPTPPNPPPNSFTGYRNGTGIFVNKVIGGSEMKLTNHQKILTLLARYPNRWFLPQDFMKPELGNLFVGYLADRRLRELKTDYPKAFKVEKERNQLKVRLDLDNIKDWWYDLSDKHKKVLRQEGLAPEYSPEESLERHGLVVVDD